MKLPKLKFLRFFRKARTPSPAVLLPLLENAKLVSPSADNLLPSTKLQYAATSPNAVTQPFEKSSFSRLPPELRLQIYEYALHLPVEKGFYVVSKEKGIPEPALLFTCKAIRTEAFDVFYRKSNFLLMMPSCDPSAEVLMMRKEELLNYGTIEERRQYTCYGEGTYGSRWSNLCEWLRLYHAGKTHDIGGPAVKLHEDDDIGVPSSENPLISSMFKVTAEMKGKPWKEVREIIDGFHCGLAAIGSEWLDK